MGPGCLGLVPDTEPGKAGCLLKAGQGPVPPWQLWQVRLREGGKVQAQALGLGLGFPGLVTLALEPLLHPVLGTVGGAPRAQGAGVGREPGVREPAALNRPDGGGSSFSPAVFLAGWAGGRAGQTQLPTEGHPPPQYTLSYNLYPDRPPSTAHPAHTAGGEAASGPWLMNHFGLLETVAEFL